MHPSQSLLRASKRPNAKATYHLFTLHHPTLYTLPLPPRSPWSHCQLSTPEQNPLSSFLFPNLVSCSRDVLPSVNMELERQSHSPFISLQQTLWVLSTFPPPASEPLVSTSSNPSPKFAKVNILKHKLLHQPTEMPSVSSPTLNGQNPENHPQLTPPSAVSPWHFCSRHPTPANQNPYFYKAEGAYRWFYSTWNPFLFHSLFTWLISTLRKCSLPSAPLHAEWSGFLCFICCSIWDAVFFPIK